MRSIQGTRPGCEATAVRIHLLERSQRVEVPIDRAFAFYGDERKRIRDLLARTQRVEHRECATDLESLVAEARLIARHEPPYNRRGRTWRAYAYLKVDLTEAWPRLKVVSTPGPPTLVSGDVVYLGPFHSRGVARMAKDAASITSLGCRPFASTRK